MTRLIKKYKNRRLYDTELSQYITVDDLQRYVIDRIPFQVQDSTTKKDITTATLLHIFVEMEAGPTTFLSPEVLRQLISLAHHPMNQSLKALFGQMLTSIETQLHPDVYQVASEAWNQQMKDVVRQWEAFFHR